ncbi:DUF1772 domain-containing protein [Spirosoma sp. HMF4905]|uniref:DUF1772 domain-containing protein n=1 Tax=Spirosoma arboris TaxID=2682092 RepID=A0A7K1SM24_9BACT|nr:anthrone oxygenase family protein [Spirosoma arboris]MVM34851.1 DUF1772 domain-containing protein [Spirosoma arboris]
MPTLPTIILTCATLTTALVAGLLYGYFCSVNPGLNRLSDTAYLSAMQSINRAIQNPIFFASFMGTLILLPISTWLHYSQPVSLRFYLLLGATILYVAGVFGVTVIGNIPLNEGLEAFNLQGASAEEIATQRARFEMPWNNWHTVRTIASMLALVLVIMACLNQKTE